MGGFFKVIFAVGGISPRSIILKIPKRKVNRTTKHEFNSKQFYKV